MRRFTGILHLLARLGLASAFSAIATFALCGLANLGSIAIQIGGIGALAPNQKGELARLGVRAMAKLMSGSISRRLL